MEVITRQRPMIKIYVTTCKSREYLLPNFDKLFQRFWGGDYTIWSGDGEYSTQLLRHIEDIDDEYFILLHEDFYIFNPIDKVQLAVLKKFVQEFKQEEKRVMRVGLQSLHDGYEGATNLLTIEDGVKLYSLSQKHNYKMSFEASIFRREHLLRYLTPGLSARKAETATSLAARDTDDFVILTEFPTVVYKDAVVGGDERIKFENSRMILAVPEGWKDTGIKL